MAEELRYVPVCEPCVRGEGSECHTPGCALWMRDVPSDGLQAVWDDLPVARDKCWRHDYEHYEYVCTCLTDEQIKRATARLREIEVAAVWGLRKEDTEWAAREVLEAAVKPT